MTKPHYFRGNGINVKSEVNMTDNKTRQNGGWLVVFPDLHTEHIISGWLAKLAVVGEPIPDRDFSNYEHENNEYCQNS